MDVLIGDFSRVRSRGQGQINIGPDIYYHDGNDGLDHNWGLLMPQMWSYEIISDTPYHRRKGEPHSPYRPKKVRHVVYDLDHTKSLTKVVFHHPNGNPWWIVSDNVFTPVDKSTIDAVCPIITDQTFYSLNREAFNYFSDAFPPVMSFSEFILGFRQLQELLPALSDTILKSIAGGFLNWKFGWENLLSDLESLGGVVQQVRDRLDWLDRTYGVPTKLGFSRPNLHTIERPSGTTSVYHWLDFTTTAKSLGTRVDMRAGCTLVQTLDFVDGTIGLLRGLVGAFGLNNPVKALWVNLPFSFVVDWFTKISSHLDGLTRLNPATGWDISNVTCSYKFRTEVDLSLSYALTGENYPGAGKINVDSYYRFVGLPLSLVDLLPTDELSPTQLALLLALLHQQS